FADEFGLALAGGCCGTTPEHVAALAGRLGGGRPRPERAPQPEPGLASLYQHVPFRQDTAFLAMGERTNANGSKAFREAMLAGRSVVNSGNYDDGDGPDSRIARMMPLVREHGAAVVALTIDEQGQARTAEWKVAVATRLIEDLTGNWGMDIGDIIVDCLTF